MSNETDKTYCKLYAKAVDKRTIIQDEIEHATQISGLFVDIFPVDYLADNYESSVIKLRETEIMRRILLAKQWKGFFRNKNIPLYKEPVRFLFFILSRFISTQYLKRRIEKSYSKDYRKYSACICGSYGKREILPSDIFSKFTELSFENKKFMVITAYEKYLSSLYGDYMKLPPKEKQITHHTFKAYWRVD